MTDSQEGAEGWVAGRAWSATDPVGADSREVGPDEAPTASKATALLQAAPVAPEIRQVMP